MAVWGSAAAGVISLLTCLWWLSPAPDAESGAGWPGSPVALLRTEGSLTALELAAVEKGGIVAKVIDTTDRSEVLSLVVMRVRTTPSRVLERFRNVEGWQRDPWVLQIGRVGKVPSSGDLEALTLDPRDVDDLARCRVNDCDVRFPTEVIQQFRKGIDWSSSNHAARASALFRQTLSAYTASYLSRGNAALFKYDNNDDPVRIEDGLRQLILRSRLLADATPDLHAYLERFPNDRPTDAEDLVYWVKERFWLLNVLSLNHSTVVDRATAGGRLIMAVSKQLYATHYYEASLSLTAYVEGPGGGGSYLFSLNRVRADIRPSGFNWLERLLVNRLVRRRLEAQFRYLRRGLEAS
jgi:hypothetical protein